MSTITLPNIRVSSDLEIRLKLKDGGVAIDWSTLTNIKASIYSDRQRSLAGRCDIAIDEEDSTILVCRYSANKPQYPGVNRVIVSCTYDGETKTYDKPAFTFVRWTDDQAGQSITIDDPDIDVEITVEDISSSILQEAVEAANSAAERANDAAAAAEHMVDIHQGPPGPEGPEGPQGRDGDPGATPDITVGDVETGEAGSDAEVTIGGTAAAPILNFKIPKGDPGVVETKYVHVNSLPTAAAGTMNALYLVDTATENVFDVYYTSYDGSAYSWIQLGTTSVQLSDYATKDELTQLEAEVHNLSGKYYGVFADESDLPDDAVTPGYAFVGTESPFAVWNFDGEEWSDSGAIVNGIQGEPGVGFGSIYTPVPYDGTVIIVLSNNDTITLDLNHTHPEYYSKILGGAQPSGGFLPDVVYSLGTLSGTITFSLAAAVTGNVNHYFWMFDTDSTAPTITWPTGITWAAGAAPTVVASKHYEISILGGVAYYSEV